MTKSSSAESLIPPDRTLTGLVFDIKKFAIHDGPGIRTTVFLKGCPLHCLWCHNPESQRPGPEISFLPDRCIGCGYCFKACPHKLHSMHDGKHVMSREDCEACGRCTEQCYAEALELTGREMTVEDALTEVLKDRPFYDNSGGGMTVSGGEPLNQFAFTAALLAAAKEESLHTCLDTSGYAAYEKLAALIPLVDIFLYDIKETSDELHRELTGVPNTTGIENLGRLYQDGAAIRLRLPLVPGLNDRPEHLQACGKLAQSMPRLEGVDIMPYHRLGTSKNERMGYPQVEKLQGVQSPPDDVIDSWLTLLHAAGAPQAKRA